MRTTAAPSRKLDHVLRFVTALSMGGLGAVRGCGGGTITACSCPAEAGVEVTDAEVASAACTGRELDAGCQTVMWGVPSGPLPPPELQG